MKTLVVVLVVGAAAAAAAPGAVPPDRMNFQGVLRDASGAPREGPHDMTFRFWSAETAGNEILVNSFLAVDGNAVTVSGGLFNVALGAGRVADGSGPGTYVTLREVFRDHGSVWLGIEVGGEVLNPRTPVLAAGFALNSDQLGGTPASGFLDTSSAVQSKSGSLVLAQDLRVQGNVRFEGGSPAPGRVLTTDGTGLGTWQDPVPGPEGPAGPTGPQGPAGAQGPPGVAGRPVHGSTIVSPGVVRGAPSAITIGADGLPLLAFQEPKQLVVAHCTDPSCASSTSASADWTRTLSSLSMTVGADGLGVAAICSSGDLHVVHCRDAICAAFDLRRIPIRGRADDCSVTVGTGGRPVVAYTSDDAEPHVYSCGSADCSTGNDVTLSDPVLRRSANVSVTVAPSGFPVLALSNGDLFLVECGDSNCVNYTYHEIPIGISPAGSNSVTLGSDGKPIVSVHDLHYGDLYVATSDSLARVDFNDDVGRDNAISIGSDGLPVVSYYDATNRKLKVAHCSTLDCASSTTTTVADASPDGARGQIAMGTDGFPIVSCNGPAPGLAVVHCTNPFCIPHLRRR